MTRTTPAPNSVRPRFRPRQVLLVSLLLASLVAWSFRGSIQARLLYRSILAQDAPPVAALEEWLATAPSPVAAVTAAWRTDKIVHREFAVRQIGRSFARDRALPPDWEGILLAAALDPDQNVCEAAFAALQAGSHPTLPTLAIRQFDNPDPELRRLALDTLRRHPGSTDPATLLPLLDDPQLDVTALAVLTLGRLVRQEFQVRLADAVPVGADRNGLREFKPEDVRKVRAGAAAARAWLEQHPRPMPPRPVVAPATSTAPEPRRRLPAPDFELSTLDGKAVRLSGLRGKVVLINFWTTWCTACLAEIPALVALHERHPDDLVILGISLDNLADSHGHTEGHEHGTEGGTGDAGAPASQSEAEHDTPPSLAEVRRRVAATAKRRGMRYPILIDADNRVGSRYNGGELPTTVLVDAEGFVRRRFVGARSLDTFEAMLRDAARPGQ